MKIISGISKDHNHLTHINGKYLKAGAALWIVWNMSHNVFFSSFGWEGKEKGSRGGWERRGKGMTHNDLMCGECLSRRLAPRTILPAIIKGRQVPFFLSVWIPSRFKASA